MKNWEKYEKEIKEIKELRLNDFAIERNTGKVYECDDISCENCEFYRSGELCGQIAAKWLYEDYEELKSTLTKEEKDFVEAFVYTDYYITRDLEGELWLYGEISQIKLRKGLFPFITWESGEAWSIAKLQELEVKE